MVMQICFVSHVGILGSIRLFVSFLYFCSVFVYIPSSQSAFNENTCLGGQFERNRPNGRFIDDASFIYTSPHTTSTTHYQLQLHFNIF